MMYECMIFLDLQIVDSHILGKAYTGASIRMTWKSSFISVMQLKL